MANWLHTMGVPLGEAHTKHEHEADRAARQSQQGQGTPATTAHVSTTPLRAAPVRARLQQQLGGGETLQSAGCHALQTHSPADLSAVRLHRDASALRSSEALDAQAWTLGTDVFLGRTAPPLQSPAGQRLLSHELTHVLQQSHPGAGTLGLSPALDLARSTRQIATVRLHLDALAQSVNSRRGSGTQISAANLDTMSRWLVEEVNVRIETEDFRLASVVQTMLATRGPQVIVGASANWTMNASTLDTYVFDFSRVFLPTDRTSLMQADQQTLAILLQILQGMFSSRIHRRFNPSPYMVGRGIPRAPVQIPLQPLNPPASFGPPPLP